MVDIRLEPLWCEGSAGALIKREISGFMHCVDEPLGNLLSFL
jgi:hypothetical protein